MAQANLDVLVEAEDRLSRPFGSMGGAVDGLLGKLGLLGGGPGAVLALAATATIALGAAAIGTGKQLYGMASEVSAGADAVSRFADRIGIATDELSVYQHQAKLANVDQSQFNMALQRMTRRMADAERGVGEALPAFDALGLSVETFLGMSPDERFARLGEELLGVEDRSQRLALAFKFFDSEGTSVLQMLGDSVEEFRASHEEAEKFANILSEDAVTAFRDFNDAGTNLEGITDRLKTGFSEGFVKQVTPVLERMAETLASPEFLDGLSKLGSFAGKVTQIVFAVGEGALQLVGAIGAGAGLGEEKDTPFFDAYIKRLQALRDAGEGLRSATGSEGTDLLGLIQIDRIQRGKEAVDDLARALNEYSQTLGDFTIRAEKAEKEDAFGKGIPTTDPGQAESTSYWVYMMDKIDEYADGLTIVGKKVDEGVRAPFEEAIETAMSFDQVMEAIGDGIDRAIVGRGVAALDTFTSGFGNAVARSIVLGEKFTEAMTKVWQNFAIQLISILETLIAKLAIAAVLSAFLSGGWQQAAQLVGLITEVSSGEGGRGGDSSAFRTPQTAQMLVVNARTVFGSRGEQMVLADQIAARMREAGGVAL